MILHDTKGSNLHPSDRSYVLRAYVHRYTKEHKPTWAETGPGRVQFASDCEWLENTIFATKKNGRLDMRYHSCQSIPTWPDHPELR